MPTTVDLTTPTRVLVLADTHLESRRLERMPAEVWDLADAADLVLHAGDITDPEVLEALGDRAPTRAILGNNDRQMTDVLPTEVIIGLGGVRVAMIHDSGPTTGRGRRMARRFPDAGVVVFGHSHQPVSELSDDGELLLNPGSPTQRRRQAVHTVGWLELADGAVVRADIVEVGPLASTSPSSSRSGSCR